MQGLAVGKQPNGITTDRAFANFEQAANEAGMSRIYGGIHFSFDKDRGLELGRRIGQHVASSVLRPVAASR
jgi:hypothetical protein